MTLQRLLAALTLLNLVLLMFLLVHTRSAAAEGVLRGRALEIVDEGGKVRASIQVLPPTVQQNGERSAETVLLRLITEKGRPSVKIAASEESAATALVGPTGTSNTYVQLAPRGRPRH